MAHVKDSAAESLEARLAASRARYWRANLWVMGLLLVVWGAAGFGASIFFAEKLNELALPGTHFPLGFWFAQQGSIVVFVLVILVYCVVMNRLDARHHAEREELLKAVRQEAGQ
jgi:putative solute:sodium symporter small subunit